MQHFERYPRPYRAIQLRNARSRALMILMLAAMAAVAGYLIFDRFTGLEEGLVATYVGRSQCVECHEEQSRLYTGSHHDLAMDPATKETVLGDFDNVTLEHQGIVSRMFMDGNRYMINTEGPDGVARDFEIKYVFGVTPLQQYMVELEPNPTQGDGASPDIGRVQVLRVSWDTLNRKWFYLDPPDVSERLDPTDPLHWTGASQRWNSNCAECHSTDLHKGFDVNTGRFHTTYSEIDVSCEACHGPASLHVQLARQKTLFWDPHYGFGLNRLKVESNVTQVDTCAPCHSRRTPLCEGWQPGDSYDRTFVCQQIVEPTYHADGQILDEDYVYGSFIQSRMYAKNIRCTDCHDPHSLKLKHSGNQLCTSCHQHPEEKYDTPAHHHHAVGGPGASCVECHMPATTYMDVDPRRDHSLRAPRPDLSVELGTPNACSACHVDRKNLPEDVRDEIRQYGDWIRLSAAGNESVAAELSRVNIAMRDAFINWYGSEAHDARTTYYESLARLLSQPAAKSNPADRAWIEDFSIPVMIRASGMTHLANAEDRESLSLAKQLLKNPEPKLVIAAIQRIENELFRLPTGSTAKVDLMNELAKTLNSEVLSVRIEVARVLNLLPREDWQMISADGFRAKFQSVTDEWRRALATQSEQPASHMALGQWYQNQDRMDAAAEEYRTAIRLDPNFSGPRTNLCGVLRSKRDEKQATLSRLPPEESRRIELTLSEIDRLDAEIDRLQQEEHQLLATDIQRSKGISGVGQLHYRYAMSCYLVGDEEGMRRHLQTAHEMSPDNREYMEALYAMHKQFNEIDTALKFAQQLLDLEPDNKMYQQMVSELVNGGR